MISESARRGQCCSSQGDSVHLLLLAFSSPCGERVRYLLTPPQHCGTSHLDDMQITLHWGHDLIQSHFPCRWFLHRQISSLDIYSVSGDANDFSSPCVCVCFSVCVAVCVREADGSAVWCLEGCMEMLAESCWSPACISHSIFFPLFSPSHLSSWVLVTHSSSIRKSSRFHLFNLHIFFPSRTSCPYSFLAFHILGSSLHLDVGTSSPPVTASSWLINVP